MNVRRLVPQSQLVSVAVFLSVESTRKGYVSLPMPVLCAVVFLFFLGVDFSAVAEAPSTLSFTLLGPLLAYGIFITLFIHFYR